MAETETTTGGMMPPENAPTPPSNEVRDARAREYMRSLGFIDPGPRQQAAAAAHRADEMNTEAEADLFEGIRDVVDQWTGEVWPNLDAKGVYEWLIRGEAVG